MRKMKRFLTVLTAAAMFLGSMTTVSAAAADGASDVVVTSYLTGESVPAEIGRRRPVAVMLGNNYQGAPQSGLANAGVVYEAPVEADITRLMGIFEDYDNVTRIGSVRSCRDYYIFYAKEFNAIYAHYGQAVYALQYLDQHVIDNLNGLTMGTAAFYRSTDRVAPHNAYTDFSYLQNGIATMGYSQEYDASYQGHYQFAQEGTEVRNENGINASAVRLNNFKECKPWFEYDETTGLYKRFQFGGAHVDEMTGEQLTCSNIILQYSDYVPYDKNGYLNIDTSSGGSGMYITRGKAINITWGKSEADGITRYYDESGSEIRLNTGKTWVEIVLNDSLADVTIE